MSHWVPSKALWRDSCKTFQILNKIKKGWVSQKSTGKYEYVEYIDI